MDKAIAKIRRRQLKAQMQELSVFEAAERLDELMLLRRALRKKIAEELRVTHDGRQIYNFRRYHVSDQQLLKLVRSTYDK